MTASQIFSNGPKNQTRDSMIWFMTEIDTHPRLGPTVEPLG